MKLKAIEKICKATKTVILWPTEDGRVFAGEKHVCGAARGEAAAAEDGARRANDNAGGGKGP